MNKVTAALIGPTPSQVRVLESAQGIEVRACASLREVWDVASNVPSGLLWLIDAQADVFDDTLPPLVEHVPAPSASLPVNPAGAPVEALLGGFAEHDVDALLEAIHRRIVPLRHIQVTSLLVERDLILDLAPPDPDRFGPYAGSEWTSRLFARRRGFLVPASKVRIASEPVDSPLHALRTARAASWGRRETANILLRGIAGALS